MFTFAPFPETETIRVERPRLNWFPLVLVSAAAIAFTTSLPGWARMWLIAIALFAGFKWWTWRKVSASTSLARSFAFLFLWPGMNVRAFLSGTTRPTAPTARQWIWAAAKTLLGATLLFICAHLFGHGLTAGWIAMVGFIFALHFGLFALLALFWHSRGIDAAPLMKAPIAAISLHDFWGRRWNAGFRDIVFVLFFFPLARRYGTRAAALATFVLSGLIHELVITVPAGGGYGLPTLYFALQGVGLMLERTKRLPAWAVRLLTFAVVVLPIGALFPPVFVTRVMVPFFQLIHAL